ncbi:hypothetical protein UY3_03253 [Chelonia mydas]|uniref:Uncharacterized protein n=1 Tax=Chelonia mydas TaxID=8469 RepID=M7BQM6_CHEMY|nr:hypothetical protein UY3_03253 [Chelonia mydas]
MVCAGSRTTAAKRAYGNQQIRKAITITSTITTARNSLNFWMPSGPQAATGNNEEDTVDEEEEEEENVQQASGGSILPDSQDLFLTLEPIPFHDPLVQDCDGREGTSDNKRGCQISKMGIYQPTSLQVSVEFLTK